MNIRSVFNPVAGLFITLFPATLLHASDVSVECHLISAETDSEMLMGTMQVWITNHSSQSIDDALLDLADTSQGSVHGENRHSISIEARQSSSLILDYVFLSDVIAENRPIVWKVESSGDEYEQYITQSPGCHGL